MDVPIGRWNCAYAQQSVHVRFPRNWNVTVMPAPNAKGGVHLGLPSGAKVVGTRKRTLTARRV